MNCVSEGDLGDAVFTLGVMSGIAGGPHKLLLRKSKMTKFRTDEDVKRFLHLIKPLAESQPYVSECRIWTETDPIDWDAGGFRLAGLHNATAPLLVAHANHFKLKSNGAACGFGNEAWLTCSKSPRSKGRIVINRTERYQNMYFPWKQIVEFYGGKLLFVGTRQEHSQFCSSYGNVDYLQTTSLVELAEVIAGSLLYIGNQSVGNAIAEGLKHPLIQETSLDVPDCVFKRDNAQHVFNGRCILPGFGEEEDLKTNPIQANINRMELTVVPPGKVVDGKRTPPGWIVHLPDGQRETNMHFSSIVAIAKKHGITREEVLRQNAAWNYEYFFQNSNAMEFFKATTSLRNAGIDPSPRIGLDR